MTEQTKTAGPVAAAAPCAKCDSTEHSTNGHHNGDVSPTGHHNGDSVPTGKRAG